MTSKVTLRDGREAEFQMVDKTRPIADKDYDCAWSLTGPHVIKKGTRYVRVVYKLRPVGEDNGSFYSDHICFDCWNA